VTPPIYRVKYRKSNLNYGPIIGGQVNYEPESIIHMSSADTTQEDMHQVEMKLKNKFEPIKLDSFQHNNFYPDRCLSHGCAEWAVETVLKFIKDFSTKSGTSSIISFEKEDLSTR